LIDSKNLDLDQEPGGQFFTDPDPHHWDPDPHGLALILFGQIPIREAVHDWFQNYLSGRKQFVTINGQNSSLKEVLLGVPQGSILGPILFLLYINDLSLCSHLKDFLFADDSTLLASGPS
jgi:hypothetical protein